MRISLFRLWVMACCVLPMAVGCMAEAVNPSQGIEKESGSLYLAKRAFEIVQGIPGYRLVAGKSTLVRYNVGFEDPSEPQYYSAILKIFYEPTSSHVVYGETTRLTLLSWLDVTIPSKTRSGNAFEFSVAGTLIEKPGRYRFQMTLNRQDFSNPLAPGVISVEKVVTETLHPHVYYKVLFVPFNIDFFHDPAYQEKAWSAVRGYLARAPFSTYDSWNPGPSSKYWDVAPVVDRRDEWKVPNGRGGMCFDPMQQDDYQIHAATYAALVDYNSTAAEPAALAYGILPNDHLCNTGGSQQGDTAVGLLNLYLFVHEIGHDLLYSSLSNDDRTRDTCEPPASPCWEWAWVSDVKHYTANAMDWLGINSINPFYKVGRYNSIFGNVGYKRGVSAQPMPREAILGVPASPSASAVGGGLVAAPH